MGIIKNENTGKKRLGIKKTAIGKGIGIKKSELNSGMLHHVLRIDNRKG